MTRLFFDGGAGFMGFLTLIFLVLLIVVVTNALLIIKNEITDNQLIKERLSFVKSIGVFALIVGMLGQSIGLFCAFEIMKDVPVISPNILAAGLRRSMIPTLYGMIIFVIAYLLYFALVAININKAKRN